MDWWKKWNCSGNGITMAEVHLFILAKMVPYLLLYICIILSYLFWSSDPMEITGFWKQTAPLSKYQQADENEINNK